MKSKQDSRKVHVYVIPKGSRPGNRSFKREFGAEYFSADTIPQISTQGNRSGLKRWLLGQKLEDQREAVIASQISQYWRMALGRLINSTTTDGIQEAVTAQMLANPIVSPGYGGAVVDIKAGVYKYAGTVLMTDPIDIIGDGKNRTVLQPNGSGQTMFNIAPTIDRYIYRFEHFKICNGNTPITGTAIAFNQHANELFLFDMELRDLSTAGVSGGGTSTGFNWIDHCYIGSPINIAGVGGGNVNELSFTHNYVFNGPTIYANVNHLMTSKNFIKDSGTIFQFDTATTNSRTMSFVDNHDYAAMSSGVPQLEIMGTGSGEIIISKNIFYGAGTGGYWVKLDNSIAADVLLDGNIMKTSGTPDTVSYGTGMTGMIRIRNNLGLNPIGLVTNFVSGTNIAPWGTTSVVPSANACIVYGSDIYITVSGGTGVSITVSDPRNNNVLTGQSTLTNFYIPVGYRINFGAFSVAPTVTVLFT
jgi:hypothetical protein